MRRLLILLVQVLLDDLTISQIGEATSPLPNRWHTNSIRDCFSIGQWDEALTRLLLGKNLKLDKRTKNSHRQGNQNTLLTFMRRSRNASNPASVHIAFISAPENSSLVITNSSKLTSSANVILAVCIYNPHIEINCMRELHRFNDEKHKAVRHEITNKSYGMISNTLLPIIKPCVPGKYASLF